MGFGKRFGVHETPIGMGKRDSKVGFGRGLVSAKHPPVWEKVVPKLGSAGACVRETPTGMGKVVPK